LENFSRDANGRDGLQAWCRECQREVRRRHREANREAERERNRRYREANRLAEAERKRRWRQTERGRQAIATNGAKRRARKRDVPSLPYTRAQVFAKTGGHCWTCWAALDVNAFIVDHVVPLGTQPGDPASTAYQPIGCDCLANLLPQCVPCSPAKGAKPWTGDLAEKLAGERLFPAGRARSLAAGNLRPSPGVVVVQVSGPAVVRAEAIRAWLAKRRALGRAAAVAA
jgi:hypothetical protein